MQQWCSAGIVQAMKVGGTGACTTAQVTFQPFPDRPPQEAATEAAQCLVQQQQPVSSTEDDVLDTLPEQYSVEILYHDQVRIFLYTHQLACSCVTRDVRHLQTCLNNNCSARC